jgi:hypothetical protein
MVELALVKLANRMIETFEKSKARGGDAGFDDTAVIGLAGAGDEAALFHAIKEPGHVRVVRNHAVADAAASQAMGLKELLGFEAERIRGLLEGNEDAVLDGKSGVGKSAATHADTIVVMTTNVKRK